MKELDELLAWMRANGVRYAAINGLVLEIDAESRPETPLSEEEFERLKHLKQWSDGFRDVAAENMHPALDPDQWGGSVPPDVLAAMTETTDE